MFSIVLKRWISKFAAEGTGSRKWIVSAEAVSIQMTAEKPVIICKQQLDFQKRNANPTSLVARYCWLAGCRRKEWVFLRRLLYTLSARGRSQSCPAWGLGYISVVCLNMVELSRKLREYGCVWVDFGDHKLHLVARLLRVPELTRGLASTHQLF